MRRPRWRVSGSSGAQFAARSGMPDPRTDEEQNEAEDDRRFSQEHDDRAGRSWHGMNSEITSDVVRFDEDLDEEPAERPGRTEDV